MMNLIYWSCYFNSSFNFDLVQENIERQIATSPPSALEPLPNSFLLNFCKSIVCSTRTELSAINNFTHRVKCSESVMCYGGTTWDLQSRNFLSLLLFKKLKNYDFLFFRFFQKHSILFWPCILKVKIVKNPLLFLHQCTFTMSQLYTGHVNGEITAPPDGR